VVSWQTDGLDALRLSWLCVEYKGSSVDVTAVFLACSGDLMMSTPVAPFSYLSTLWVQVTGTWCNLQCVHCINASGPKNPWLKSLDTRTVKRSIREAETFGVKEIYFTGGEPFLHEDIIELLAFALQVAPTTILTNGTMINDTMADVLAALARQTPYSFEIRVSLDDIDPEQNDRIRGHGSWAKALKAIQFLHARGLLPILTATEPLHASLLEKSRLYTRFRDFLLSLGINKPRVKIIPIFPVGRMAVAGGPLLTDEVLQGFDFSLLQCSETRVVAEGGIYSCPILAGLAEARLAEESLQDSFKSCRLYHPACVTCYHTGMTCKNF
jgi:AdoMet-dependent heme synthase